MHSSSTTDRRLHPGQVPVPSTFRCFESRIWLHFASPTLAVARKMSGVVPASHCLPSCISYVADGLARMPPWQAFHAGTIEGDAQLKLILNEQVRKELNYSRLARM